MHLKPFAFRIALLFSAVAVVARATAPTSPQIEGISAETPSTTAPKNHLTSSSYYALSLGGSGGSGTIPLCASADDPTRDPILSNLASNLGNDPIRIYEWVRNNIRTELYYGAQRGALMTYNDRAGNDIDQCALLGALLRAAGYTPKYYLDNVTLPRTTEDPDGVGAYAWLGVSSDAGAISLLRSLTPSAGSDGIRFNHMWVSVKITPTRTVKFLPSVKPHTNGRRQDIAALAGESYSLTKVRTAAAATNWTGVTSNAISSSGLRTFLTNLTVQVSDILHGSPALHDLSGPDLAGLRMIVPSVVGGTARSTATSFPSGVAYAADATELSGIPQAACSVLTITMGTYQKSFFSPDLLGRPLAVEFDGSGVAILRLDGAQADENAQDAAGGQNDSIQVKIRYDFPAAFHDGPPPYSEGSATFVRQKAVALSYAFGRTSYRLRDHERRLAMREADGTASTDTDRLQTIGLQYQSQSNEIMIGTSAYLGCEAYAQVVCGFISIKNNKPKVDFPISRTPTVARAGENAVMERNVFFTAGMIEGALEGTALEQSATARGYGMPTLFDYAMMPSQNRGATLVSSVAQLNAAKADGTLQHCDDSNLGGGSTANIENALNNGGKVVLLSDSTPFSISNLSSPGSSSSFSGYLVLGANKSMQTVLGTAYGGGTPGQTESTSAADKAANKSTAATDSNQVQTQTKTADPVDLTTGAFLRSDVDIAIGQDIPLGIKLVRSYNGALRFSDPVKLGRGWTHNFNMRVTARHPSDFDTDRTSIDELLPTLVAAKLIYDAIVDEGETTARTWLIASVAATWACDQQIGSRGAVTMGERTMEFVRRPNGSYTAPGNVTATLANTGSGYTLSIRHGDTVQFRASDGKFEQIVDQFGNTLTSHYNSSGYIDWVKDAFGRALYFNYTNGQLTSVDEVLSGDHTVASNTTRTVGYEQDSVGLHVTDTEGKTSTFEIDGNRRLTKVKDGRGRTVVQNFYDAWHRVDQQYILGDSAHLNRIRVAPGIGAEIDATGKAVWTYFDARGRKVFVVNQAGKLAQWHYDGVDCQRADKIDPLTST